MATMMNCKDYYFSESMRHGDKRYGEFGLDVNRFNELIQSNQWKDSKESLNHRVMTTFKETFEVEESNLDETSQETANYPRSAAKTSDFFKASKAQDLIVNSEEYYTDLGEMLARSFESVVGEWPERHHLAIYPQGKEREQHKKFWKETINRWLDRVSVVHSRQAASKKHGEVQETCVRLR